MSEVNITAMNVPGMYDPTVWQDHVTEFPRRRRIVENGDGTVNLEKDQGEIIRQGTPQSATNFNHMEHGIMDAHLATVFYLNLLRQQGWKMDQLAEVVSTLASAGIGTERYSVNIPTEGWEANDGGAYALRLDIPNGDISANHTPILAVAPGSMAAAVDCGLATTVQTLNGKLRLFAQSVPTARIASVLTLVGTSPDIAATSGDTGASGGVSVAGSPARTTASDSDVDAMLRDIFG